MNESCNLAGRWTSNVSLERRGEGVSSIGCLTPARRAPHDFPQHLSLICCYAKFFVCHLLWAHLQNSFVCIELKTSKIVLKKELKQNLRVLTEIRIYCFQTGYPHIFCTWKVKFSWIIKTFVNLIGISLTQISKNCLGKPWRVFFLF